MPVEIKELVVRAVVQAEGREHGAPPAGSVLSEDDKQAMLQACVKEVLRALRKSKER